MKFSAFLLATLAATSNAAAAWVKGTNLCVGVDVDCTSVKECAKVMIGPCDKGKTSASSYLVNEIEGVAFVKAATYYDAAIADKDTAKELLEWSSNEIGYLDRGQVVSGNDKWAFTQTGDAFGEKDGSAWAYAGTSSYFNNGNTTLSADKSVVYTVTDYAKKDRKDRSAGKSSSDTPSDSKYGAPEGPFTPCITQITGGKCGAKVEFAPDAYKFNLFMHFQGTTDGFAAAIKKAKAEVAYTHVGVRQKLSVVGAKVSEVKVNGATWDKTKINQNVKDFSLKFANGETVNVAFPGKYNIGKTDSSMTPIETKDVQIRMYISDKGYAYVDYLFEEKDVALAQYLIYDPVISDERTYPGGKGASGGSSPAVSAVVSTSVLAMLAALF